MRVYYSSRVVGPVPATPHMSGRSYSPGLARFLTQVRLEELMSGEHPYGYALANPTSYVDPNGTKPQGWLDWLPFHEHLPPAIRSPLGTLSECVNNEINPDGFFFWIGWEYGNCCGKEKKCGEGSFVWNCTDAACRAHDICVGESTPSPIRWYQCSGKFCNDLRFCWNNHCVKRIDGRQCRAIRDIASAFCAFYGGVPPGEGTVWK